MNLILSNVEETIMLVEEDGGGKINVRPSGNAFVMCEMMLILRAGREAEDGHAVRARRWCHSRAQLLLYSLVSSS